MTPRLPNSKRMKVQGTLDLTLLEMSQQIRRLQRRVYVLKTQRNLWRERARALGWRMR